MLRYAKRVHEFLLGDRLPVHRTSQLVSALVYAGPRLAVSPTGTRRRSSASLRARDTWPLLGGRRCQVAATSRVTPRASRRCSDVTNRCLPRKGSMTSASRRASRALAVVATYVAALVAGLSVVSFPASATVLKAAHGLSDSSYGANLPAAGRADDSRFPGRRRSLRAPFASFVLGLSLVAFAVAEVALFGTSTTNSEAAYLLLLAGTGSAGVGFGLSAAPLTRCRACCFRPARRRRSSLSIRSSVPASRPDRF